MNAPNNGNAQAEKPTKLLDELAMKPEFIVQELGWDEDIDFDFRNSLEDELEERLLTEEEQEPVDAVLMWWRADEGDVLELTDTLVDAMGNLDDVDHVAVWLLTPRSSKPGYVNAMDVTEATEAAGMKVATSAGVSDDWAATRLEPRNV